MERIGLFAVLLLLAAAFVFTALPARLQPFCILRRATGIPCPACGSFRATALFFAGHPLAALAANPLATLGLAGAVVFLTYSLVVVAFRLPRIRIAGPVPWRGVILWGLLALMLNWAWVAR